MVTPRVGALGVIEAKGDLPGFDGVDLLRVPVGTNGWVPIADSTQAAGWRWGPLTPSNLPPRDRFFVAGNNAWVQDGSYSVISIGQNANINITFKFPNDFGSLISVGVLCIPLQSGVNRDIDFFSQYAGVGELKNANAQSNTTGLYTFTADTVTEFEVGSLFSAAQAEDIAGIRVVHNGINATIQYVGVHLVYNGGP
jgi:hypothetical protein